MHKETILKIASPIGVVVFFMLLWDVARMNWMFQDGTYILPWGYRVPWVAAFAAFSLLMPFSLALLLWSYPPFNLHAVRAGTGIIILSSALMAALASYSLNEVYLALFGIRHHVGWWADWLVASGFVGGVLVAVGIVLPRLKHGLPSLRGSSA